MYDQLLKRADKVLPGNELRISNLDFAISRVDITQESAVDIADQEIEDFLIHLMPALTKQFLEQLPSLPIPGVPLGPQLKNASLEVFPNMMTIKGDL